MSARGEKSPNGVTTFGEVENDERQNDEPDNCIVDTAGASEVASRNLDRQ